MRAAGEADAAAIAEIHVSAWQAAYRGEVPDSVLDNLSVDQHTTIWQHNLTRLERGLEVFVSTAAVDQRLTGFVVLAPCRDADLDPVAVAEIEAIYVHPTLWRRGAGRALLDAATKAAQRLEKSEVSLWVLQGNRRARRFYERAGFEPDGRRELRHLGGVDLPTLRYRKQL